MDINSRKNLAPNFGSTSKKTSKNRSTQTSRPSSSTSKDKQISPSSKFPANIFDDFSITKWKPFDEMSSAFSKDIRKPFDDMSSAFPKDIWKPFDDMSSAFPKDIRKPFDDMRNALSKIEIPSIKTKFDVRDSKDCIQFTANLPGMKKEDIIVKVENNSLIVKGTTKTESNKQTGSSSKHASSSCSVNYLYRLPQGADGANMKSEFNGSVLTVTVPKKHLSHSNSLIPIESKSKHSGRTLSEQRRSASGK